MEDNELSASLEDYLEAVFAVIQEKKAVRAKDIAVRLNVSRSSVTGALQTLAAKGFINYAPYDVITLTSSGEDAAGIIFGKHNALKDFFHTMLLIDPVIAEETACKMEHAMSENVISRLRLFSEFVMDTVENREEWVKKFTRYCNRKNASILKNK